MCYPGAARDHCFGQLQELRADFEFRLYRRRHIDAEFDPSLFHAKSHHAAALNEPVHVAHRQNRQILWVADKNRSAM